jgi:hypothetical protein
MYANICTRFDIASVVGIEQHSKNYVHYVIHGTQYSNNYICDNMMIFYKSIINKKYIILVFIK